MTRLHTPRTRTAQAALGAVVLGVGLLALPGLAAAAETVAATTTGTAAVTTTATTTTTATATTTTAPATTSSAGPSAGTASAAGGAAAVVASSSAPRTAAPAAAATTAEPVVAAAAALAPAAEVAAQAPVACVPLTAGSFQHTFDPQALTLTVEFLPTSAAVEGSTLCGGGQPFTVATWATQETGYALPQRLLGTSEASVTLAGPAGRVVVTAPSATGCTAQVDAYMAPAFAVPAVLTGFNTGEPRPGGPDAGAVNEPPLVGTPQAPYPSEGTVDGQQPYTLVAGTVCTLPATLVTSTSCSSGTMTGTLAVTNPNPWTVRYEVLLNGVPVDAPELADPGIAGGRTEVLSAALEPGTYTVRVIDENGVEASTSVVVEACDTTTTTPPATTTGPPATTTTVPPVTTTADPTVDPTSTGRTTEPTATTAPSTSPVVSGVVVTRSSTPGVGAGGATAGGTGGLAATGASTALPLGLGAAALAVGGGLLLAGRTRTRSRHAR